MFGPKIGTLPDDHPSEAQWWHLEVVVFGWKLGGAKAFLLLDPRRVREDHRRIAWTLGPLFDTSCMLELRREGMQQVGGYQGYPSGLVMQQDKRNIWSSSPSWCMVMDSSMPQGSRDRSPDEF